MADMTHEEIEAQATHWHRTAVELRDRAETAEAEVERLRGVILRAAATLRPNHYAKAKAILCDECRSTPALTGEDG